MSSSDWKDPVQTDSKQPSAADDAVECSRCLEPRRTSATRDRIPRRSMTALTREDACSRPQDGRLEVSTVLSGIFSQ